MERKGYQGKDMYMVGFVKRDRRKAFYFAISQ